MTQTSDQIEFERALRGQMTPGDFTAQAMAIKVFDDLGVLPGSTHRAGKRPAVAPDPLVIGRVVLPACYGGPERRLSFVVAWFIDTRDLDKIR